MAKKTIVPQDYRHLIHKELNAGTSRKALADRFGFTYKAMDQFVFDNYRQDGWEWRYR
jgi:hypothetical protein